MACCRSSYQKVQPFVVAELVLLLARLRDFNREPCEKHVAMTSLSKSWTLNCTHTVTVQHVEER